MASTLGNKVSDWLDFWSNKCHPSSRGDEVKGREEHPDRSSIVVFTFSDSASDNSSVALHCVQEAVGIFFCFYVAE